MEAKRAAEDFRVRQHAAPHPALAPPGASADLPARPPPPGASAGPPLPTAPPPPPDTARVILHFDADAFYAQVEELRDPSLKNRPLAVTQKFLVVTANYPARSRGVTKLMATKEALRRCPELACVCGEDLTPYRAASRAMLGVLRCFGPAQRLGLDEVFVDVTAEVERIVAQTQGSNSADLRWEGHIHRPGGASLRQDSRYRPMDLRAGADGSTSVDIAHLQRDWGAEGWWARLAAGTAVARAARAAVRAETGLRTSAGVACNRMLAKLISGIHKPDDQTALMPPDAAAFVAPLPVRALPGVGHKTEADLAAAGVSTVSQLRAKSEGELRRRLGDRTGALLAAACWGLDPSPVVEQGPPKSVTVEDSFRSCQGHAAVVSVLRVLCPDLIARLAEEEAEHGRRPSKLTVKWRIKRQGWSRNSATADFPRGVLGARDPAAAVAALEAAAAALLAASLKEPFDLTLINLGATGFLDGPDPAERSVMDLLRGGQAAPPLPTALPPLHDPPPPHLPAPSPTPQLANQSAAQRRDYGAWAPAAMSKRAERAAREGGAAGGASAGFAVPGCDINGDAEPWDEDDDSLWDDLAGLAHGRRSAGAAKPPLRGAPHTRAVSALTPTTNAPIHPLQRCILHLDIDSFYCAVERLDDPSLRGVPLAVEQFNSGGFVAVSYEARAAGIRCGDGAGAAGRASVPHLVAMGARSVEECRAACPGLVVRPMRPNRYREIGVNILKCLTAAAGPRAVVEKASCDDFYLDVTAVCGLDGFIELEAQPEGVSFVGEQGWSDLPGDLRRAMHLAARLRATLVAELGLAASCGVARSKLVSRLASALNKPNGLTAVADAAAAPFLRSVPLRKVPSLKGKLGKEVSDALGGITTVGQLLQWPEAALVSRFGPARGTFLAGLPHARDDVPVTPRGAPKTLTAERSFPPAGSQAAVLRLLRLLADELVPRAAADADEHGRAPGRLGVAFRLGYDTGVASRSGPVPPELLRTLCSPARLAANLAAAAEAAAQAAVALLSSAADGRWDVTRAALVLHYSITQQQAGGPSVGALLDRTPAASGARDAVPPAIPSQKAAAAPKRARPSAGGSYRNPEAVALQALFAGDSGGSGLDGAAADGVSEEELASMELALRLQREEAMAAARAAGGEAGGQGGQAKRPKRRPLDRFFVNKKNK